MRIGAYYELITKLISSVFGLMFSPFSYFVWVMLAPPLHIARMLRVYPLELWLQRVPTVPYEVM